VYRYPQTLEASSFVTNPIIFGDFIKLGAAKEEKTYEEIVNMDKLHQVLIDVRIYFFIFL